MTNLSRYTPQIGENFDELYNIDEQSSNNTSVFQDNEYIQGNVTTTLPQQIGDDPDSWIYTWGAFDEQDNPSSIGVSFTEEAFNDMFGVPESEDEFPRLVPHLGTKDFQPPDENNQFDAARVYDIPFPEEVDNLTPFTHMGFYANSEGHAPSSIYDEPHVDVHFFNIPLTERETIQGAPVGIPGGDNPNYALIPAEGFLNDNYVLSTTEGLVTAGDEVNGIPLTADTQQGVHWAPEDAIEFQPREEGTLNAWEQTFIFGSYAGEVNFWEPMITQNFLDRLASSADDSGETVKQAFEIERPTKFMEEGFYPLEYSIAYTPGDEGEQGEYTISLDKLTFEEADIQDNEPAPNSGSLTAEDQLEITKLLSEYDIAIDNGDLEGTVGSFTTDGELNAPFGSGEGVEGLTQFHQQLFDSGFDEGARHLTGNVVLDGDSHTDTATGLSYLVIFEAGDRPGVIATATQTDTFRQENGDWKIESRQIEVDPGFLKADTNGDDLILGTPEQDTLNGFQGKDRLFGLAGGDLISGGEGDDLLQGDAGDDRLFGNAGRDILSGGQGLDSLTGGEDADIFIVQSQGISDRENYDVLDDFELGIDVLALDEIKFGQLSIHQEGDNTQIWDAQANELLSVLNNTHTSEITADVFIDWN